MKVYHITSPFKCSTRHRYGNPHISFNRLYRYLNFPWLYFSGVHVVVAPIRHNCFERCLECLVTHNGTRRLNDKKLYFFSVEKALLFQEYWYDEVLHISVVENDAANFKIYFNRHKSWWGWKQMFWWCFIESYE